MADEAATARNADDAAALYFGDVMHARLKPMGHRFSYRVMSLLIDLDRLDEADRQIGAVRRQPRGALQLPRGRSRPARRLARCAPMRERCAAEHGIDLGGGRVAAALLSPPARLHLQSAVGLFLLSRRRRAGADDLRGAQHLWRHPSLRAAGEAGRSQRGRLAAAAGQAVLRLALHRDGDALSFPRLCRRAKRSSCGFWRPTATARCSRRPSAAAAAP